MGPVDRRQCRSPRPVLTDTPWQGQPRLESQRPPLLDNPGGRSSCRQPSNQSHRPRALIASRLRSLSARLISGWTRVAVVRRGTHERVSRGARAQMRNSRSKCCRTSRPFTRDFNGPVLRGAAMLDHMRPRWSSAFGCGSAYETTGDADIRCVQRSMPRRRYSLSRSTGLPVRKEQGNCVGCCE